MPKNTRENYDFIWQKIKNNVGHQLIRFSNVYFCKKTFMDYRISSWDSNTHEGLNKLVNDFLIENEVQVANISFSTIWNPDTKAPHYTVCILYTFEE
jgi:hypothetical protein